MHIIDLITKCPQLYHMAEDGSWPSIQQHGLLSTSALLTKWGYTGKKREVMESSHRPKKICIYHADYGKAVIRDQIPMPPEALETCLTTNMIPDEWYKLINGKIFFWTSRERLEMFLAAKEYKNIPQLVIIVDTQLLLESYASRVTLSSINSGSTYYDKNKYDRPPLRGLHTFKQIGAYNLSYIRELVVEEGIQDITNITVSVSRKIAHRKNYEEPDFEEIEELYHR